MALFLANLGDSHGTPLLKTQHWIKKIAEDTGLHISPHDLRRSFISYAAYTGIREDVARRLSNHAINLRDAHAGYVIHNAEAMRAATNKVSDYVIQQIERWLSSLPGRKQR